MACVNSRVATALVGCTAPVLKTHTHIKYRGAENSLYLTRTGGTVEKVKSFFEIFFEFFHLFSFNRSLIFIWISKGCHELHINTVVG
ncbi:hypothetical protein D9H09_05355 [Escherichia coli]|nr:hypothetical protein [Escherichia coli]